MASVLHAYQPDGTLTWLNATYGPCGKQTLIRHSKITCCTQPIINPIIPGGHIMIRNRESLIIAEPQSNHITGFSIEEVANLTARNAIRVFSLPAAGI